MCFFFFRTPIQYCRCVSLNWGDIQGQKWESAAYAFITKMIGYMANSWGHPWCYYTQWGELFLELRTLCHLHEFLRCANKNPHSVSSNCSYTISLDWHPRRISTAQKISKRLTKIHLTIDVNPVQTKLLSKYSRYSVIETFPMTNKGSILIFNQHRRNAFINYDYDEFSFTKNFTRSHVHSVCFFASSLFF